MLGSKNGRLGKNNHWLAWEMHYNNLRLVLGLGSAVGLELGLG